MVHELEFVLKDNGYQTANETANALKEIGVNYSDIIDSSSIVLMKYSDSNKFPGFPGRNKLECEGHLCCSYDVRILMEFDKSNALKENVIGVNDKSTGKYHQVAKAQPA